MKTHWKKLHNPDYIGAYAFQPGEVKTLTIKGAEQRPVMGSNGKAEDCMVVEFAEEKPLVCNVTNAKAISAATGSAYIEDWVGHKIQLRTEQVKAFGSVTDAVRVIPRAVKPKEVLDDSHPKWDKAIESLQNKQVTVQSIKKNYEIDELTETYLNEIYNGDVDA